MDKASVSITPLWSTAVLLPFNNRIKFIVHLISKIFYVFYEFLLIKMMYVCISFINWYFFCYLLL